MNTDIEGCSCSSHISVCSSCSKRRVICCDSGYMCNGTSSNHDDAFCVTCCPCKYYKPAVWDGKSVAGGTFERTGIRDV